MGEIYKAEIAKQNREIALAQKNSNKEKDKPFEPIQAESKSETHIDIFIMNELLKNANENIKEDFKLVVKKMFRERKNCAKVISNDLLQADQD
ncbi:hypothetical protein VWO27_09815, partial [Campylobacter coli]|nr:hypothetical protein [Campylobacter coli]